MSTDNELTPEQQDMDRRLKEEIQFANEYHTPAKPKKKVSATIPASPRQLTHAITLLYNANSSRYCSIEVSNYGPPPNTGIKWRIWLSAPNGYLGRFVEDDTITECLVKAMNWLSSDPQWELDTPVPAPSPEPSVADLTDMQSLV